MPLSPAILWNYRSEFRAVYRDSNEGAESGLASAQLEAERETFSMYQEDTMRNNSNGLSESLPAGRPVLDEPEAVRVKIARQRDDSSLSILTCPNKRML